MLKLSGIPAIAFLVLIVSCGGAQSGNSKIIVNFNSSDTESESGVKVSHSSGIPSDVTTVDIRVYNGETSELYYEKSFAASVIVSASSVTIEVSPGGDRVVKAIGRSSTGLAEYSVRSDPLDLHDGESVDVFLVMKPVVQDAQLSVRLLSEDGSGADYSVPSYAASIKAEVYIPAAVSGEVELGSALSGNYSGTSTSFNLNAYPDTYQMIMVRVMTKDVDVLAPDGVVAAIGSAIVSELVSGINPQIVIRMVKPGRLGVTNSSGVAITSYSVVESINGSDYVISSESSLTGVGNTILLTVPNGVPIWGSAYDAVTNPGGVRAISRTVKISINGGSTVTYQLDGITYPYLRWKQIDLSY